MLDRPHIVQPVGQFNQQYTTVLRNRDQELSDVFGLPVDIRRKANVCKFRDPVHERGGIFPEE